MATKKQKHEQALARREAFLAEERVRGAKALKKEHDRRERENWEAWRNQHDKKHVVVEFNEPCLEKVKECPLCQKGVLYSRPPKVETKAVETVKDAVKKMRPKVKV